MFNSHICLIIGKSAGLILLASCFHGLIIEGVSANISFEMSQENLEKEQNSDLAEIKIFCSTILKPQNLQEIFPDLIIETGLLTVENAAQLTTCPQQETVLILKSSDRDDLIASREKITELITKFYIDEGYLNSRAILYGSQDILIDEGQADVIVEGTTRLNNYVRKRIIPAANPFNTKEIEDRLRLLKADPLIDNIEATLKPAAETNTSQLIVNVTEAKSFFGSFGVDNYSPPSTGGEEFNLNLGYRNLTGIGDTFAIIYKPRLEAFTDTYDLDINYQAPLNSRNGTLDLGVLIERNEVIAGDFEDFDIKGETETYRIAYRQPLILTSREEFTLSIGFSYRDGQTFLLQDGFPFGVGPDEEGISRTSVFNLGQEYIRRDSVGAWGVRSQFRIGVNIFDATNNDSPIPDGQFFSWLAQMQRIQVFNDRNFLIIQGDLQLTPNSLLPSEQFTIGGGQSVRGYRENVRFGDNGFRFSLEDRITLIKNDADRSVFVMAPFFNMGVVWNKDDNPNQVPDDNVIAALGLGLLWQPIEGLNLRLDYAPPLIDLDDRGDNIQDDGLHFSANYSF
ncbi:MAG: ShlB/FhaC/HecB family hemolysin secretion/activation protein [Xenococcus sp. (in: cyanobacteria)]